MLTHDYLLDWLQYLSRLIFDTKISIDNIKRITHPQDDFEKQVLKHGFFSHCYFQWRFTIIIQLCKIFDHNKNQKRNLFKLFNRLTTEEFDESLKETIENNEISPARFATREDIILEINSLKNKTEAQKEIIDRLVNLRDKIYAHSDIEKSVPNVTNQELELLIDLAIRVHKTIFNKIFGTTFIFEHTTDWKADYPIKALAKIKKERFENLSRTTRKKN
jgi:hypothetical protein